MATNSELYGVRQLEPASRLSAPFQTRQDRWEPARPDAPARDPLEAEPRALPLDAPAAMSTGETGAEDARGRLPRPVLWLAFAGWALSCAMLFVTLVQREPPPGTDRAWIAEPLVVATWGAAMETVFGDPEQHAVAEPGPTGTVTAPSTRLP